MLDFLVFLLDIPSLLADFSPRAKHKGESPYWRFMGLFLLTAELVILFLWDITESPPALVACITLGLWLIAHLSIRAFRNGKNAASPSVPLRHFPHRRHKEMKPLPRISLKGNSYIIYLLSIILKYIPGFLSYKFLLFERMLLSGTLTCISNKPGGGR